ncbi:VOC family protein [Streptomyces sp. NPDC003077]|uniref:VOC family protein n=1 Tax=Streptomyces sp. NPDC003077 TaxID=3154443 RepID=UPI0033BF2310
MLSTSFVPGAPNWLDLGVPDTEAAAAFYGSVFGWTHHSAGPDAGGYGMFALDGKYVAGIGPLVDKGDRAAWNVYFHTQDADATAKAVEQAGGTVRFQPMDVFTSGRMAGFTDPVGARFSVWQPRDHPGLGVVNEVGTLCWTELFTTDAEAAKRFYGTVFAWRTEETPVGEHMTYSVVRPATGDDDSTQGGIMRLPADEIAQGGISEWSPYFEVADCDATVAEATRLGATMRTEVMSMEYGRFAFLRDPFGATFAVITSVHG